MYKCITYIIKQTQGTTSKSISAKNYVLVVILFVTLNYIQVYKEICK